MRLLNSNVSSWITLLVFLWALPAVALGQERPKGKKKADAPAAEAKDADDSDKPKGKGKTDDGDNDFGSARKKGKGSDDKPVKGGSAEDRATQKYKGEITKRVEKLLRKGMNYYVAAVREVEFEKWEGDGAPPPNVRVLPGGYIARPRFEVQVLDGREMAVEYLVDYLAKYPPQQKSRSSRAKRGEQAEPPGPPEPIRELVRVGGFKEKEQAFAFQDQLQQQIEAAERGPAGKKRP